MSTVAAVITEALAFAALFGAIWVGVPRWHKRRKRRRAPFEHARLSCRHKREWRRFKRGNKSLREHSRRISQAYEEAGR